MPYVRLFRQHCRDSRAALYVQWNVTRTTAGGMMTDQSGRSAAALHHPESALEEARRMLDAFISVGADRFHVTFTNLREEKTDFLRNRTVALDAVQPPRLDAARSHA